MCYVNHHLLQKGSSLKRFERFTMGINKSFGLTLISYLFSIVLVVSSPLRPKPCLAAGS